MIRRFVIHVILGCAAVAPGAAAAATTPAGLHPRAPLPKPATVTTPAYPSQLIVKFADELKVRERHGAVTSGAGAELAHLREVANRYGLTFEQRIRLPQSTLDFVEARAAIRSGIAQPDLAGMMVVHGPDAALERAAKELLSLDSVEWVDFSQLDPEPPCSDLAPTTPHYYQQGLQPYHGPDPGVNMTYAWSLNARGQGVKIADCEYGYIDGTEDLCDIVDEPGQTMHPGTVAEGWHNHGTAVLGEMIGLENDYGVTGLVPEASGLFFMERTLEENFRRVTAITNAIATVDPGDIVVLEMQTIGPGEGYAPAELDYDVWTVTKLGTDSGVIVVAAAGNGDQDLDSAPYAGYMSRGDSGAIIVGAGTADTGHDKLDFSTYGSRVDIQAWGEDVFTLGYGFYSELGGDERQRYTASFGGTSSATPLVTSAVAAMQSLAMLTHGCSMEPEGVRQLLIDTGIAQGTGGHIGPFPDLQAASDTLINGMPDCSYGCGNDNVEGSEECDGVDPGSCEALCTNDCRCLPSGPGSVDGLVVMEQLDSFFSDRFRVAWNPACVATDHVLVYGPLAQVGNYAYSGQICGLGDDGEHGPIALGDGSYFFLVVGNTGGIEGSYGTDSGGQERPEQVTDPVCTLDQDLTRPCTTP